MAYQFKVGERYKLLDDEHLGCNAFDHTDKSRWKDMEVEITKITDGERLEYTVYQDGQSKGSCSGCIRIEHLIPNNSFKKIMSNVVDKIKFAMKSEPAKTLIKAGIIDENEALTTDGKEVLMMILKEKFEKELAEKAAIILSDEETK